MQKKNKKRTMSVGSRCYFLSCLSKIFMWFTMLWELDCSLRQVVTMMFRIVFWDPRRQILDIILAAVRTLNLTSSNYEPQYTASYNWCDLLGKKLEIFSGIYCFHP
jgi:hypothetical protein